MDRHLGFTRPLRDSQPSVGRFIPSHGVREVSLAPSDGGMRFLGLEHDKYLPGSSLRSPARRQSPAQRNRKNKNESHG